MCSPPFGIRQRRPQSSRWIPSRLRHDASSECTLLLRSAVQTAFVRNEKVQTAWRMRFSLDLHQPSRFASIPCRNLQSRSTVLLPSWQKCHPLGNGSASNSVTLFTCRKSTTGRFVPSFFLTSKSGDEYGEFDRSITPNRHISSTSDFTSSRSV